jgi:hypothetical protein
MKSQCRVASSKLISLTALSTLGTMTFVIVAHPKVLVYFRGLWHDEDVDTVQGYDVDAVQTLIGGNGANSAMVVDDIDNDSCTTVLPASKWMGGRRFVLNPSLV